MLLVTAVVAIGLLVDALAATYQRVALAGLPLLGLYAVGTGMHPHGPLWLWFLLAGFGYLALLLTEGQDRLSRWGKVFTGTAASMAGTPAARSTRPGTGSPRWRWWPAWCCRSPCRARRAAWSPASATAAPAAAATA
ncbi:transglutaminaseTgpA domain-containing protein [Streptacidiphilus monticola]